MKDKRFKAYFYLCISAFFLILAATLYYSFGYVYDPQTGESFQAGAIVVRTTPRDAVIRQDDTVVENTGFLGGVFSPFVKIENLEPKTYEIKVTKDGYNQWRKNITIESGQVAKYENIVLLKNQYNNLPVLADLTLPEGGKLWMATNKNELLFEGTVGAVSGFFLADIRAEEYELILDKSQLDLMGAIEEVDWTEDDGRIVLRAGGNRYLIDLRDKGRVYLISASVNEAMNITPDAPVHLFDHFIIFNEEETVYSFDYVTKEIEKVMEGVSNYYVYQGSLFFFKSDDASSTPILYSTNLDNLTYSVRVSSMPEGYSRDAAFTLQRYGGKLIAISSNTLYYIDHTTESHKINSNVEDARFFQHGERILYYNNNEVWLYYIEDKTSQPIKSAGTNELLTRFSGRLSNIYVYADEEHLLYQENSAFKFTELDERDNRNTYNLRDNMSDEGIFYLGDRDLLYFIGADRKLYKIDLREE